MGTGKYWRRYLLRNSYAFDHIIEEVVRAKAQEILATETGDDVVTRARRAMAQRVLDRPQDEVVLQFHRVLKDRAVGEEAFLTEAFRGATPDASGITQPKAQNIPDAMLDQGVEAIWNDATLVAWPEILTDMEG